MTLRADDYTVLWTQRQREGDRDCIRPHHTVQRLSCMHPPTGGVAFSRRYWKSNATAVLQLRPTGVEMSRKPSIRTATSWIIENFTLRPRCTDSNHEVLPSPNAPFESHCSAFCVRFGVAPAGGKGTGVASEFIEDVNSCVLVASDKQIEGLNRKCAEAQSASRSRTKSPCVRGKVATHRL